MRKTKSTTGEPGPAPGPRVRPGKFVSIPKQVKHLDTVQLEALSEAFRAWLEKSPAPAIRRSRGRVWLIYLVLRFSGAKLGEVLAVDDQADLDLDKGLIRLGRKGQPQERQVQLPEVVVTDLRNYLADPGNKALLGQVFSMDQGFIRKKFYERGAEAALPKTLANPTVLRRSRAIELLRSDVPLTVVQSMLGQASSNSTANYIDFSDEDTATIISQFMHKEAGRKTSARNMFYGRISRIVKGDIQSEVALTTPAGQTVYAVITNRSLDSLELAKDKIVAAIIKAPWVMLAKDDQAPMVSARNVFPGRITQATQGRVTAEVIVELDEDTQICAIVSRESWKSLGLGAGDRAWVMFNDTSVILDLNF
jgi:molybdate transport system regulatory protein